MQSKEFDRLRRAERSRDRKKSADSFWRAFLLTENGKVKSTLLLNAFCLSVVFLAVYGAAYYLLLDVLQAALGGAPVALVNLVEALVPAVAGTAVCSVTWLFREKRLMLAAYLWLAFFAAACLITLMILLRGDGQARRLCLQVFALFVPAPILLGGGLSAWLYHRCRKRKAAE